MDATPETAHSAPARAAWNPDGPAARSDYELAERHDHQRLTDRTRMTQVVYSAQKPKKATPAAALSIAKSRGANIASLDRDFVTAATKAIMMSAYTQAV